MKKMTIGVMAHVDAGKTTFCEQLLFHTQQLRNPGRVDHKNTFMDNHPIEQARGITIFTDQAYIKYENTEIYLLDTPGHVDFSAEMERALIVMDYGILIISAVEGVEGHTETLWMLLKEYKIPSFVFINKVDREGADVESVISQIKEIFGADCINLTDSGIWEESSLSVLAEQDDASLEAYLEGNREQLFWMNVFRKAQKEGSILPVFHGSALFDRGIDACIKKICCFAEDKRNRNDELFSGIAYKVKYDSKGLRWVYIKCITGRMKIKDVFTIHDETEKVNQIKRIQGNQYVEMNEVSAGDLVAVAGLNHLRTGEAVGSARGYEKMQLIPTLQVILVYESELTVREVFEYCLQLEDEDPMLGVLWRDEIEEIALQVMGTIQLEILEATFKERFNLDVAFSKPEIIYKETIATTVVGYGHFEPLKHYAEVHIRIEPGHRNEGITFASLCHTDNLPIGTQNLVKTHLFEKEHHGLLGGYGLTDIHITLLNGAAHQKHTHGGDFREAAIRALRQGLEQAENILLEPVYAFDIRGEGEHLGRFMADVQKAYGRFEDPVINGGKVRLKGIVPVVTFLGYGQILASYTSGKGQISLKTAGYEPCHNTEEVLSRRNYNKQTDKAYPSSSVFCSKGTSYSVPWYEAKEAMHCDT